MKKINEPCLKGFTITGLSSKHLTNNWHNGIVVRAFALQSVGLWFVFQAEFYHKTLQNGTDSYISGSDAVREWIVQLP